MTKLSDTQLASILSAAAQRDDLSVLPLPETLKAKGGAAQQGAGQPPKRGPDPGHRDRRRGPQRVVITREGLAGHRRRGRGRRAGGRDATPRRPWRDSAADAPAPASRGPAPSKRARPGRRRPSSKAKAKAAKPGKAAPAEKPTPRAGTKQALMIELLKRPEGATVEQIAAATGWQHHTIRGAISGALKKKLGLTVEATRTREVGPNKTGAKGSAPSTESRVAGPSAERLGHGTA